MPVHNLGGAELVHCLEDAPLLLITSICWPGRHGAGNLLIAGERVVGVDLDAAGIAAARALPGCCTLDLPGLMAVPGFVDMHVHVAGGGGEAGYCSRTPEAKLSELVNAGITSVVGVCGTDSVSRSQENLAFRVRGLREEGLSAWHWCGSYRLPAATATGGVQRDVCLLDSCVGVGEVAVSDHRGSVPTPHQLAALASEARVAGMLSGKAGLVHVHMGPGQARLQPLRDALATAAGTLPITQFHPTHMARSRELAEDGARWLSDGGTLDITVDNCKAAAAALARYKQLGLALDRVTLSTDAYGSLPVFDASEKLVGYDVARPDTLLAFLRHMVLELGWAVEQVLPLMTANPARILKLRSKGKVEVGADADVLLLDHSSLQLKWVLARGVVMKTPDWVRGSVFERGPGIRPHHPDAVA